LQHILQYFAPHYRSLSTCFLPHFMPILQFFLQKTRRQTTEVMLKKSWLFNIKSMKSIDFSLMVCYNVLKVAPERCHNKANPGTTSDISIVKHLCDQFLAGAARRPKIQNRRPTRHILKGDIYMSKTKKSLVATLKTTISALCAFAMVAVFALANPMTAFALDGDAPTASPADETVSRATQGLSFLEIFLICIVAAVLIGLAIWAILAVGRRHKAEITKLGKELKEEARQNAIDECDKAVDTITAGTVVRTNKGYMRGTPIDTGAVAAAITGTGQNSGGNNNGSSSNNSGRTYTVTLN
jgi:hypothetical protein